MKAAVTGTILETRPISLSGAASVVSTFASAETGASQAVSKYLMRASKSMQELVRFHREVEAKKLKRERSTVRREKEVGVEGGGVKSEVEDCLSRVEERESVESRGIKVTKCRSHKKRRSA